MDMTTISAAYTGLKTAKDIFTGLNDLKVETATLDKINEAVKKVGEAQDTLFALREELFKLQEENNSLKSQLAEAASWDNKLSDYTLAKTNGGAIVYKFNGDPVHYLCPSCLAKHEIHFLQDDSSQYSGRSECQNCHVRYSIEKDKDMPPIDYDGGFVV